MHPMTDINANGCRMYPDHSMSDETCVGRGVVRDTVRESWVVEECQGRRSWTGTSRSSVRPYRLMKGLFIKIRNFSADSTQVDVSIIVLLGITPK